MGDTRAARWKRTVAKWRRQAEEMKAKGDIQVIEPPHLDVPPHQRGLAQPPTDQV